jgi:hypothetical protein
MTEAECRERAEWYEKEAAAEPNSEIKARLERIAKYWRELGWMAERRLKRCLLRVPPLATYRG